MDRVAVFSGPSLRRHLRATARGGPDYEFFPLSPASLRRPLSGAFSGALVELSTRGGPRSLEPWRRALPDLPLGSLSLRCDAEILKRSRLLGFDFHLGSWRPGDPPGQEVLAHLRAS